MAQTLQEAIEQGFRAGMEHGQIRAVNQSQGTKSYQDLADEDHPYATRHGSPQSDPGIINKHSGEFADAWQPPDVMVLGDTLHGRIINDSPVADFLNDGTTHMFARPIGPETEVYTARLVEVEVKRHVADWAKTHTL